MFYDAVRLNVRKALRRHFPAIMPPGLQRAWQDVGGHPRPPGCSLAVEGQGHEARHDDHSRDRSLYRYCHVHPPKKQSGLGGARGAVVARPACVGSRYRSGRTPDWLKFKNPDVPAVKREAEEQWAQADIDGHGYGASANRMTQSIAL